MLEDIVTSCRRLVSAYEKMPSRHPEVAGVLDMAADEIESLRQQVAELREECNLKSLLDSNRLDEIDALRRRCSELQNELNRERRSAHIIAKVKGET